MLLPVGCMGVFLYHGLTVPDDSIKPKNWYGINGKSQVYRYACSNDNSAHFSGIDGVGDGIRNMTDYARDRIRQLRRIQ